MTAKDLFGEIGKLEGTQPDRVVSLYVLAKDEYYNKQPTLSDTEFNMIEEWLVDKGLGHVTKIVGAPVDPTSKFIKRTHTRRMLSLNKVKDINNLITWMDSNGGDNSHIITFKFDGLACKLVYSHGVLIQGVTRGDGDEGEDIIENIKLIPSIPHEISRFHMMDTFCIFGEIYILRPIFDGILAPLGYKTPRNAAAGIARMQSEKRRLCAYLNFTPYNSDAIPGMHTFNGRMLLMRQLNFTPPLTVLTNTNKIKTDIEVMTKLAGEAPFDIDGLVIRVDDDNLYHNLGNTSHHPKGSMTFKFEDKASTTTLKDIEWQTGPTGEITPVAIVVPVVIDGVTIERVNLHNYTFIEKFNLDIGCEVEVIRANDVIPQIVGRVE